MKRLAVVSGLVLLIFLRLILVVSAQGPELPVTLEFVENYGSDEQLFVCAKVHEPGIIVPYIIGGNVHWPSEERFEEPGYVNFLVWTDGTHELVTVWVTHQTLDGANTTHISRVWEYGKAERPVWWFW